MKLNYFCILSFLSSVVFAQQKISFESSENYTLGNIHGQNNWEVTLNGNNEPISGQTITNVVSTDGSNCLRLSPDSSQNPFFYPIFGAAKQLDESFDYKNFVIEFDAFITNTNGSTFEFGTFGASGDKFMPISTFSFTSAGKIEVVVSEDYDYQETGSNWNSMKWYKLKMETTENSIKYYVDGNLVFTGSNFSKTNILGIIFLHTNFNSSGYIDKIKINNEVMAVSDVKKANIKLYPNPVKDILKINLSDNETISEINIYNATGQKLKTVSKQTEINVESLSKGLYLMDIKTDKNKTYNSKFIKQ